MWKLRLGGTNNKEGIEKLKKELSRRPTKSRINEIELILKQHQQA